MNYLSYISHSYATGNKLEEKVLVVLMKYNRRLVSEGNLDKFTEQLLLDIERLNEAYPRSHPVKITFTSTKDRVLSPASNDFFVTWNNVPGSNGRRLCEFKLLAATNIF